jgi:hypothetical protein
MAGSPCLPSVSIRLATIASRSTGCCCRRGIVTVRVDMLPCDRRDCPGRDQRIALACKGLKPRLTEFSAVWAYNPSNGFPPLSLALGVPPFTGILPCRFAFGTGGKGLVSVFSFQKNGRFFRQGEDAWDAESTRLAARSGRQKTPNALYGALKVRRMGLPRTFECTGSAKRQRNRRETGRE